MARYRTPDDEYPIYGPGVDVSEPRPTVPTTPTTPTTPAPTTTPSPTPGGTGANDTTPLPINEGPKPGNLEGFDQGKLDDKGKQTIKYRAARVFQQFSPADFVANPAAVIAALKAAGLNPTLVGKDKIDFNDGYGPIDVVRGASQGGKAWVWQPTSDGGVTETAPAASTGVVEPGSLGAVVADSATGTKYGLPYSQDTTAGVNPDYLTPWTREFVAPAAAANPAFPSWDPTGEFQGPGEFVAPTYESMLADPSYQFRLGEGRKALENSAAARGVLNSGGTLADILNYGQQAASQEYQNIFNRDLTKWQADWSNALNKFGVNLGAKQGDFSNLMSRYNAQQGTANDAWNRAWQGYIEDKDTWYRNQNEPFNKLYNMASLGAGASQ